MDTILLIILTIIFLIMSIVGILSLKIILDFGIGRIASIGMFLFFISVIGLFYLGTTLLSNNYTIEETICMYTVGKLDEVCHTNYELNLNYMFSTTSDKIALVYFLTASILTLIYLYIYLKKFLGRIK